MTKASDFFAPSGAAKLSKLRDQDTVFFVEGTDDCWFLGFLLAELNLSPEKILIISADGQDNFEIDLKIFCKSSPYKNGTIKSIALLRDADDDFSIKLNRTQAIFSTLHWPTLKSGEIRVVDKKFGLFIFPADNQKGDLETLCFNTVKDTPLGKLSKKTLEEADAINGPLDQLSKRQSQLFLALSKGRLCRGVGKGFSDGRFETGHKDLDPIRCFVSKMAS